MPDSIFNFSRAKPGGPPHVEPAPTAAATENLAPCPDCARPCSRYAEACPGCGRFFRAYDRQLDVWVNKRGWWLTIAGGVFVGWLLCTLINAVALVIVLAVLGLLALPLR